MKNNKNRKIKQYRNFILFLLIIYFLIQIFVDFNMRYTNLIKNRNQFMEKFISGIKIRNDKFYNLKDDKQKIRVIEKSNFKNDKKVKKYYIQIGIYSVLDIANTDIKDLKEFNPSLKSIMINNKKYYKVVVENINSKLEAKNILKEINKKGFQGPFIREMKIDGKSSKPRTISK
ncbi:SPOR domain-containing protein [Haliovirga abyssi]|uniref:SPOR domain-containing protein n=1 Tax=Haliovirga abyssi TaxID=2996794 RepID=A0AAU9E3F3_9FUSO|nr:SPOR domain-containing protein [Haliovirga abyssi]BDU50985.1 hypothetical protein HLVA_15540 [Haliovirga abyssi]